MVDFCSKCKNRFLEKDLDCSHDVPCYLFEGNRKGQKNQADKFTRRWLCRNCHKKYEYVLRLILRKTAAEYAEVYFKEDGENDKTV